MIQNQNMGFPFGLLGGPFTPPPFIPAYIDDKDLIIDYHPSTGQGPPGPQGPQGDPGPQGPPGSLSNVPVTLIDETIYTPNADEYFLGVIFNGLTTITLPAGTLGKTYVIKDAAGDSNTFPITIITTGSTIDMQATYIIDNDWASVTLVYNGIEWNVI